MNTTARITTAATFIAHVALVASCDAQPETREDVILVDTKAPQSDPSPSPVRPDTTHEPSQKDASDAHAKAADTENMLHSGCPMSRAMASNSYVCEEDATTVEYSATQGYERPDNPPSSYPRTLSDIRTAFGDNLPEYATAVGFGDELEFLAGDERAFAEWGQDVTIHIATIHERESYGNSRIFFTALLNYRPTKGHYRQFSMSRSKVIKEHVGTRMWVPVEGPVELIDITIPAEAFDRRGRYDLAIGWGDRGALNFSDRWKSFHVYYGGCSPPSHKCAKPGGHRQAKNVEKKIQKKFWATAYLYPVGDHAGKSPFQPIEVEGGSSVKVEYALKLLSNWDTSWMIVPFINGRPLDKRRHSFVPKQPANLNHWVFGAPGTFSIPIPKKPGKYEVELGTWNIPFLSRNEKGTGLNPVPDNSNGSNSLIFVVKE